MSTLTNRRRHLFYLGSALLATALVPKRGNAAQQPASPLADTYTCPMHPQVIKNAPGKCPICGMNLVKKESAVPQGAMRR